MLFIEDYGIGTEILIQRAVVSKKSLENIPDHKDILKQPSLKNQAKLFLEQRRMNME